MTKLTIKEVKPPYFIQYHCDHLNLALTLIHKEAVQLYFSNFTLRFLS